MLTGNLLQLSQRIDEARPDRKGVVVTTSLESAIGREMVRLIASTLGDPELDHGLNTGSLFREDLLKNSRRNETRFRPNLSSDTRLSFERLHHPWLKKIAVSP